ncbi:alpha/beta fold hydrolase [Nakamurella sp. YIM 132087]|uniref:Alpha/beta fold hydrolase n=1 Tax=Nakamurella alba TaxID=2665158 RepID=A0A7K1FHR1_9ACTN|nr:alpha/beta fold hydrolase [Nakamurella alba]MTD13661.1 alpha/beta fold hydrolase [Nakamurella alba]
MSSDGVPNPPTAAWPPPQGPAVHDELVELSDAPLAGEVPGTVPGMADEPPPGEFEVIDGRGLYVRVTQPEPGPGPDAWYVHGLAGSSTNWIQLAGALAGTARGYLVDLPGHGRSDPPPRGRYSLVDDADLVAAAIRRRSCGPVHLVGNSLGGMVVVALAHRHPDLVASLTLISPAVPDLRMTADRGADPRLALLLLPGTTGVATRRLGALSPEDRARGMGALCFGDPDLITDAEYEAAAVELGWRFGLPWLHTATIGSLRALMTSYLTAGRWSFAAAARTVRVPTLVIWGTRDKLVDARLAAPTAALFADARLLVLRGVGHTSQMEEPATVARAVAALWRSTGGTGAPHPGITSAVATSSP